MDTQEHNTQIEMLGDTMAYLFLAEKTIDNATDYTYVSSDKNLPLLQNYIFKAKRQFDNVYECEIKERTNVLNYFNKAIELASDLENLECYETVSELKKVITDILEAIEEKIEAIEEVE